MVIEGRDLVDLGLRQPHFLRQRRQVRRRQAAVAVLDLVQVLDQQIGAARGVAQQGAHFVQRLRLDAPALGLLALAFARGGGGYDRNYGVIHLCSEKYGSAAKSWARRV